jgi:hypothetical protein
MIKTLKKLLAMAIIAASSSACSLALLNDDEEAAMDGEFKIVVNGVASDAKTNTPLTGTKVTFNAFPENSISVLPLISKTAYTDSKGIYNIEVEGFSEPVRCTLTAETDEFCTMTNKLLVTWCGNSFDYRSNTFYVNECNFQMTPSIP